MVPIALLAVIYAKPLYFLIGIGVIGTACLYEYFRIVRAMGIHVQPLSGYPAFWALLFLFAFRPSRFPIPVSIGILVLLLFLFAMWRYRLSVRQRAMALMAELLGVLYFSLFLSPALQIRFEFGNSTGLHWMFILLFVIWAGDTFALLVGKKFGKTKFAAVLSPKKTNEGALAGLLAGIGIAALIQHLFFQDLPLHHVLIAAALLGIFGQLGDLAESMLKRAAEIKDSSQLIPGHGGVLDRMDSLLFAFPVLYFYMLQIYS
jgi:phosphatidate cytidylyltransferase